MTINIQTYDHSARINMTGRFDFKVHRDFKNAYAPLLNDAAVQVIDIEMSKVDYIDSSALGMLMLLYERAKAANKTIELPNPSRAVSQMLEVANFDRIINIKQTALPNAESRNNLYGCLNAVVASTAP